MTDRRTGRVARTFHAKGFCFIQPDDHGPDIFCHANDTDGVVLGVGARVSYAVQPGARGPRAVAVEELE